MLKRELNPKDLLLAPNLNFKTVSAILSPVGIKDIKKGDMNLQLIADDPRSRHLLSEIIEEFLETLSRSPDPDQALNYFERFSRKALNKANLLSYLKDSPHTVWLLAKVFGTSPFMSEVLIRYPHYLYWIADNRTLEETKTKVNLRKEFSVALKNLKNRDRKIEILCVLKHKELLRIGVRDLLMKASLEQTVFSLTILAEIIIEKIFNISEETLKKKFGKPLLNKKGEIRKKAGFTVLAMGKLGGGELNFSSDLDLIFLHESDQGKTSGARPNFSKSKILNREYFKLLSQEIITGLSGMTPKGFLYRVDLRLRPEGRSGEITTSLKGYWAYYNKRGETWEKLALLKAWPVAGNVNLGKRFLQMVSRFIYHPSFSFESLSEVKCVKEEIDHKMAERGQSHLHVKLGIGGIREIEFVLQSLQIYFGKKYPEIHDRQTLRGLKKLFHHRLIPLETYEILTKGYIFLRKVENSLQMVNENQTHSLPDDQYEFMLASLRLDYRDHSGISASDQFRRDYQTYTGKIREIFQELFDSPENSVFLKSK